MAKPDRDTIFTRPYDMGREDFCNGREYDPDYFFLESEQASYKQGFMTEAMDLEFVLSYYTQLGPPDGCR